MPLELQELRKLSDEEIIKQHDTKASATEVHSGGPEWLNYYLMELARRAQEKQTSAMLKYTGWITIMTFVMTVFTIANVILFFVKSPCK